MSILQNPLLSLSLLAVVVGVQMLVVYLRKKTNQIFLPLLPNLGLFGFGIIISGIGYVVALNETGSWAGLGLIILLMVTVITTIISTLISLLIIFLIKPTTNGNPS
jgi:hypothetical protein